MLAKMLQQNRHRRESKREAEEFCNLNRPHGSLIGEPPVRCHGRSCDRQCCMSGVFRGECPKDDSYLAADQIRPLLREASL